MSARPAPLNYAAAAANAPGAVSYASAASSTRPKAAATKRPAGTAPKRGGGNAKRGRGGNAVATESPAATQPATFEDIRASHVQQSQKILALLSQFNADEDDDSDIPYEEDHGNHHNHASGPKSAPKQPRTSLDTFPSSTAAPKKKRANLLGFGAASEPNDRSDSANTEEKEPKPVHVEIICQICLTKVKLDQAIWQCEKCYSNAFHMYCIKKWANEALQKSVMQNTASPTLGESSSLLASSSSSLTSSGGSSGLRSSASGITAVPAKAARDQGWNCPNCRGLYGFEEIPTQYRCYCGKIEEPEPNPWNPPHCCGEVCDKQLKPPCGHSCTEKCHPGRCQPCPQQLKASCFCGAVTQVKRCSDKNYSCSGRCRRLLDCGEHYCSDTCHEGECQPCDLTSQRTCRCGLVTRPQLCAKREFQCDNVCSKALSCGHHKCPITCHAGPCPPCERSLPRQCFCGKKTYNKLPCTEDVKSCGITCGKMLACNQHRCTLRCHDGPCETCRLVVTKVCRCGKSKREVLCSEEARCEKRCDNWRNCKRHRCHQKCHIGPCPPCLHTCDKTLNCKNHQCQAVCHTGKCEMCPLSQFNSCPCGHVKEEVPCGPKKVLPHLTSHTCMGQHKVADVPCTSPQYLECHEPCDNVLTCGVHKCTLECHTVTQRREIQLDPKDDKREIVVETERTYFKDNCETCKRICDKSLIGCPHKCKEKCHLNQCPPCPMILFIQCYCTSMKREIICHQRLDSELYKKLLCCGSKCLKQLKLCTHACQKICHQAECPSAECDRKVKIQCKCKNRQETVACPDAQSIRAKKSGKLAEAKNVVLLECNADCAEKQKQKDLAEEAEAARKAAEALSEASNSAALAEAQAQSGTRRRNKNKEKTTVAASPKPATKTKINWKKFFAIGGSVVLLLLVFALVLYTILELKRENRQQRMQPRPQSSVRFGEN